MMTNEIPFDEHESEERALCKYCDEIIIRGKAPRPMRLSRFRWETRSYKCIYPEIVEKLLKEATDVYDDLDDSKAQEALYTLMQRMGAPEVWLHACTGEPKCELNVDPDEPGAVVGCQLYECGSCGRLVREEVEVTEGWFNSTTEEVTYVHADTGKTSCELVAVPRGEDDG